MLAAFVVTLLAGLAVKYGLHRFPAAVLLNVWFVIALALRASDQASHVHTSAWAQALAWLAGSALTIFYTCIVWLVRERQAQPPPAARRLPGDTTPVPLTRPVISFAVLRAVAVAIATAIAFGLHLPDADWMPIATLVAAKLSLQQSALVAGQRLAGAIIGAAVAALFLLTIDSKITLAVLIVILGAVANSIQAVNYAWYCAAVATEVLIGMGLPHPASPTRHGAPASPSPASGSPSSRCSWLTGSPGGDPPQPSPAPPPPAGNSEGTPGMPRLPDRCQFPALQASAQTRPSGSAQMIGLDELPARIAGHASSACGERSHRLARI